MVRLIKLFDNNNILFSIFSVLLVLNLILFVNFVLPRYNNGVGAELVKVLYEFEDITDIPNNLYSLSGMFSDDVINQLSFNNDSRVISAYFKFQASPSRVKILKDSNIVLYSIINDYISSLDVFTLYYEIDNYKFTSIREYKLVHVCNGNRGVI